MHIVMVVAAGLVVLAVFYFGATLIGRAREEGAAPLHPGLVCRLGSQRLCWRHPQANIPIMNEIGAFIPIFGIRGGVRGYPPTGIGAERPRCERPFAPTANWNVPRSTRGCARPVRACQLPDGVSEDDWSRRCATPTCC